jgi:hypothetical protein
MMFVIRTFAATAVKQNRAIAGATDGTIDDAA